MTIIEGVDYAWNGPSADALVRAGKRFAVRYGGPGSAGKQLTAPELRNLTAAGIAVVANAEGSAGGFRGSVAGRDWATSAQTHFSKLGMPADRPIYFSVDWAAGPGDWPDIDAACRGAASVIGAARVGVYGGYATIAHCFAARTAAWFWQTYAWSGSPTRWHPANHLEQYRNGVTIGGSDLDLTRAMQDDYGQWGVDMPLAADDWKKLTDIVNAPYLNTSKDGAPETPAGHLILSQGIPDGFTGERVAAWQAIQRLGVKLASVEASVTALAARPAATVSPEDLKAAVLAALREILVKPAP